MSLSQAKRYEKQRVKNKSTYWLTFELEWRDFMRSRPESVLACPVSSRICTSVSSICTSVSSIVSLFCTGDAGSSGAT